MNRTIRCRPVLVLSLVLAAAAAQASINISGTLTVNATLGLTSPAADGVYIVTADLTVENGATLTVEAGVEIRFTAGTSMYISTVSDAGILLCQGTSGLPILMTSDASPAGPGDWGELELGPNSTGSELEYTTIEYGSSGMVTVRDPGIILTDCDIRRSSGYGLQLSNPGSVQADGTGIYQCGSHGIHFAGAASCYLVNCSITDNGGDGIWAQTMSTGTLSITGGSISRNDNRGIHCDEPDMNLTASGVTFELNIMAPMEVHATQLGGITGCTYTSNGIMAVRVRGETVTEDATWEDQGIPYRFYSGDTTIQGQDGPDSLTTVTIEPGVTLEFDGNYLQVGHDSDPNEPGALVAQGLPGSVITFTSEAGIAGDWDGLYFADHSDDTTCLLDLCVVECGGGGPGTSNVTCSGSSPTITDSIVRFSATHGIAGTTSDAAPVVTSSFVRANLDHPISLHAASVGALTTPLNTYGLNGDDRIRVAGDTVALDSTWIDPGIPYSIEGEVNVQGTDGGDSVTTLTIEPGAELQFASTVGLWIGTSTPGTPGALSAVGTPGNRITFIGAVASPGYWDGIYYYDYADDALCLLEYCDIQYGGYSANENLYCYSSSPTFRHCNIDHGAGSNLYATNDSDPVIEDCDISQSNYGIYSSLGSGPQVTGGSIHDNGLFGVYVYNGSHVSLSGVSVDGNDYGLYCNAGTDSATVTGCSFTGNTDYPIRIYASQARGITGCTYSVPGTQKLLIIGDTITQDSTWEDQGIEYFVDSGTHIFIQGTDGPDSVTTLTIEPGAILEFDSGILQVGHDSDPSYPGGLMAVGTEADPITFTGDVTTPGSWLGITFEDHADDSRCVLEHCIVEYGGNYTIHNVTCLDSSPTLRNCELRFSYLSGLSSSTSLANPILENCYIHDNTFHGIRADSGIVQVTGGIIENNSDGIYLNEGAAGPPTSTIAHALITGNASGIWVEGSGTDPVIVNCVIESNNGSVYGTGVYVTGGAEPLIGGSSSSSNSFDDHDSYGVYNDDPAICVNAQYNYWGASGGPHDAGSGADGCMDAGNVNLAAEWVTEDVDYSNWIDIPPTATPTPAPPAVPTAGGGGLLLLLSALGAMIALGARSGRR